MFPTIINTNPNDQAQNVKLDTDIIIEFGTPIYEDSLVAGDTVKIIDRNTDNEFTDISLSLSSDDLKLTITTNTNFEYLTQYEVIIENIYDTSGDMMQGSFSLSFTTVGNFTQAQTEAFSIVRSIPKEGQYYKEGISFKANQEIDELNSDLTKIFLFNDDDPEEAKMLGKPNLITPGSITINGQYLRVEYSNFNENDDYSIEIGGLVSQGAEAIRLFKVSFKTYPELMLCAVEDLKKIEIVKDLISEYKIESVVQTIYESSVNAKYIAELAENDDIDWNNPPYSITTYVKLKTQYELLFEAYTMLTKGATEKVLENFKIKYGQNLGDIIDFLDVLKRRYKKWEDNLETLGAGKPSSTTFTRGSDVIEAPAYKNRGLKDFNGGDKRW